MSASKYGPHFFKSGKKGDSMKSDKEFCLECQEPHSKVAKKILHPIHHTPAPWIANNKRNSGGNIIIKGFGGTDVAAVFMPAWGYDAPRDEAEAKANAKLIEVAPELLQAAEIGLRYMKAARLDEVPASGFLTLENVIKRAKGKI